MKNGRIHYLSTKIYAAHPFDVRWISIQRSKSMRWWRADENEQKIWITTMLAVGCSDPNTLALAPIHESDRLDDILVCLLLFFLRLIKISCPNMAVCIWSFCAAQIAHSRSGSIDRLTCNTHSVFVFIIFPEEKITQTHTAAHTHTELAIKRGKRCEKQNTWCCCTIFAWRFHLLSFVEMKSNSLPLPRTHTNAQSTFLCEKLDEKTKKKNIRRVSMLSFIDLLLSFLLHFIVFQLWVAEKHWR